MTSNTKQLDTKIAQLFISQPEARSMANIYVPRTTPLEVGNFGHLFMILEIDSDDQENKKIITSLQEEIKSAYYGSSDFTIEAALENALKVGNEKLKELISSGLKSWVEKFNAIIGVVKNSELHFTQVGHTHAFLIHQQKIIDILENSSGPTNNVNPLKVFSNVISGTLSADDSALFCSTSLLDYLSQEKLRRIVSTSAPEKAVKELGVLLDEGSAETPFAAIVVKLLYTEEIVKAQAKTAMPATPSSAHPDKSMNELIAKEENTAEYLTPSIWPKIVKNVKSYTSSIQYFLQNKILRGENPKLARPKEVKKEPKETAQQYSQTRRLTPEKPETLGTKTAHGAKTWVSKFFKLIIAAIKKFFSMFRSQKRVHGNIRTIPHKTSKGMAGWIIRLKEMPLKQKILLLCALLLIFVFAFNIVNLGESKEEKAQKEQYVQNVARAKELAAEAESALIYENEEEARVLLVEARSLLDEIPAEESNLQEDKNNTLSLIQISLDTVNHVENITNPNLIADLSQTNPEIAAMHAYLSSSKIYTLDSAQGLLIEVNLEDQETKVVELSGSFEEKISNSTQRDEDTFIVSDQDNNFYKLDIAGSEISKISVQSENTNQEIKTLATYLSRLYVLDTKNNQIFRHEAAGQGYASGTAWLDEGVSVEDANSITIDGSVYLARNNGEILKLHAGAKAEDFTVSTLNPEFSNPTVIKATTATDNLYILDPNNKRLVVLNKEGNLIKQIYSEKFDLLKDFALDEDSAKVYLLNGNSIYAVDI